MPLYGYLIQVNRSGNDGARYTLTKTICTIGRGSDCDVTIVAASLSPEHCRIVVNTQGEVFFTSSSPWAPALLNNEPVQNIDQLFHYDVFTVVGHSFRFETPSGQPLRNTGSQPPPLCIGMNRFVHVPPRLDFTKCITDFQEPAPRSGHRIVVTEDNIWSIGGYNSDLWDIENDDFTNYPLFRELWKFNFATRKWKKMTTLGHMPKELASHSAILLGQQLVVYGGTGIPFGVASSNEVYVCNLKTLRWSKLSTSGDVPLKTYGNSVMLFDEKLCVFGGTTGWQYNAEVHTLDLNTLEWEDLNNMGNNTKEPPGRYRQEVALHKNKLYIFGGGRADESYGFENLPAYDLLKLRWQEVKTTGDGKHGFPQPRKCHSCIQQDNELYMCGGYNGIEIFGDFWKFNLDEMKWTKLEATMPKPVYFHSTSLTKSGCMYIYGGVTHIDDIRTSHIYRVWLKIPKLSELSWQNITHTVADIENQDKSHLLQLGIPIQYLDRIN
ncbi:unnamed protein product [Owenia fusiformis]|uniref:Uncharacterized protein n=1 Tax=Owenia fusiformis TaxID=6347 RepID=A0A8J1XGK0_OWEFU|nr:unnamed protein product [Owenia fusiformis]